MAKIIAGERIGKLGKFALGCLVVTFDPTRVKVRFACRTAKGRYVYQASNARRQ